MKTLAEKKQYGYGPGAKTAHYTDDVKEHVNRALKKIRELSYKENDFDDLEAIWTHDVMDIFKEEFGELVE